MAINPQLITAGVGLLGGLFGRKQSAAEKAQARLLEQQAKIMKQAYGMASSYDPNRETQIAADFATAQSGRALENAMKTLNQQFKVRGGSPTGDTNFAFRQQRAQDDILNPLAQFLADRRANEFALKLNALTQAGGMGGQTIAGYSNLAQQQAQGASGFQDGLSAIINSLMGGSGVPKASGLPTGGPIGMSGGLLNQVVNPVSTRNFDPTLRYNATPRY